MPLQDARIREERFVWALQACPPSQWAAEDRLDVIIINLFFTQRRVRPPTGPRYENMTSFVKPEVHNVSQRRHRMRTEPRPQATCTKKNQTSAPCGFELRERTETVRETDRRTNERTYSSQQFAPLQGRSG